jgi:hypothetical protein
VKAALHRLTTSTYSYTVIGDYWYGQKYRASGTHDSKNRKDSRTYVISGGRNATTRKVIVIGDDSYEKIDGAGHWQHADLIRLKPSSDYRRADPKDPSGLVRFAAAIHSTRRLGPRTFEGDARVEVTPGVPTYLPLAAPIFGFDRSTWVSYTLTTDAKGDVAQIRTVFETTQGGLLSTTTFSHIGKPVQITKPSQVTELRRSLYDK